jgi:hypothetical protein
MDSQKETHGNPSKVKERGLLSWIRTQLTPEQRQVLDKMDEDFIDTLITFAEHRPDGVRWVARHFWLMVDQDKSL